MSFELVNTELSYILRMKEGTTETIPIILVGNKMDLTDERVISYEEGKNYANDCKIPVFLESSAKTAMNIQ
jgi:GTPase SAR1 family protein